jgi:SAM-dependent methyltransferase
VSFARQATRADVAVADAGGLPFADASFDVILIRDLLHHLPDRSRALLEARRVLRPGGRLTLIEPNARSPLVLLQIALIRAERGVIVSTSDRVRAELQAAGFQVQRFTTSQPLPLARLVLHPRFGASRLGSSRFVTGAFDLWDRVARWLMPRGLWLYLVFRCSK